MEAPGPGLGPGSGSGARGPAGRRPPLGRRVRGDRGWAKRSGEAALGPGRSGGGRLGRSPGPREGVPRGNGRPGGGGGGCLRQPAPGGEGFLSPSPLCSGIQEHLRAFKSV